MRTQRYPHSNTRIRCFGASCCGWSSTTPMSRGSFDLVVQHVPQVTSGSHDVRRTHTGSERTAVSATEARAYHRDKRCCKKHAATPLARGFATTLTPTGIASSHVNMLWTSACVVQGKAACCGRSRQRWRNDPWGSVVLKADIERIWNFRIDPIAFISLGGPTEGMPSIGKDATV